MRRGEAWKGAGRIEVALPTAAAERLGLGRGARLTLTDRLGGPKADVEVTGLYRPTDTAAPYWRLDDLAGRGVKLGGFTTYGPLLAAPGVLTGGGVSAGSSGRLAAADSSGVTAEGTDALRGAARGGVAWLRERPELSGSTAATTALPDVLDRLDRSLLVSRSTLLVVALQLALLAGCALPLVARLLNAERAGEQRLLLARGASRAGVAGLAALESLLLAVPAPVCAPLLAGPLTRWPAGPRPAGPRGRADGAGGCVGQRQVHADEHPGGPGLPHRRCGPRGRARPALDDREGPPRLPPRGGRLRLPADRPQSPALPDGGPEHRPAPAAGRLPRRERPPARAERALELLESLDIADCRDRRPRQLSGGQQQRVAIAVALANNPAVLLAHEPTGELDSHTAEQIFTAFRTANERLGTTVGIVTHDQAVAGEGRRTVAVRDGRTSTEVLRRSEVDAVTGHETVVAREYAMLDRAGRLQLPADYTAALGMRDRVALEQESDHVAVRPDDSESGGKHG